ncbi:hypothetical protein [Bacteroides acidifaciens]|jgi:hypothetical protein|uniref:hypothetical protein n=1 Tax=Bacteroides acidifaciens TaxID=85831 RepID=UPI002584F36B|nr:hypothetical protein [Bacteroides acidifaciens]
MSPDGNGIVEIAVNKQVKERGFNCMQLIRFLTDKDVKDWNKWHEAHILAANGQCEFAAVCPVYARTTKNRPIQLKLF